MIIKRSEKHKKKRRLKKISAFILGLALIIACAGNIGTFAWFTSTAASSNSKITVGTFQITLDSEKDQNINTVIFDGENIQPASDTHSKIISFTNVGNIDMVLKGTLNLQVSNSNNQGGVVSTNPYRIKALVYKNSISKENILYSTPENGLNFETFNIELNKVLDPQGNSPIVFKQGDKLICSFALILDGTIAKNINQCDVVTGNFKVEARQNIVGAPYSQ